MSVKGKEPEQATEKDGVIVVGKMRNRKNADSLGADLLAMVDDGIKRGDLVVTYSGDAMIVNAAPKQSRPERAARNPRTSRRRARSSNG